MSKLSHIPDYQDIKCQNMNIKVIELDTAKICQSPQDWMDYIYYVIGIELVLLISKSQANFISLHTARTG